MPVTRASIRPRACRTRASSSAMSGTTRLAASVGVEARRSATSSSRGRSASCPIALTTGVRHSATARISRSSLNGSRFWKSPPPRATMMTSTSGSVSSDLIAPATSDHARSPCTDAYRMRNCTAGQRSWALRSTSFSASESLPVTRPMHARQERQALLAVGGEQPLVGEFAAQRFEFREQIADADMTDVVDLHREGAALGPPLRLHEGDDAVALAELLLEFHQRRRPDPERQRDVLREVLDLAVGVAARESPLGDLALDPDGAEPVDVVLELARHHRDRPRCLGRRPLAGRRGGCARLAHAIRLTVAGDDGWRAKTTDA